MIPSIRPFPRRHGTVVTWALLGLLPLLTSCAGSRPIKQFIPMGHNEAVIAVDVTPDGRYALSGSNDGTVKLWDLSSGHEIRNMFAGEDSISAVGLSPDAQWVLTGHMDGSVRLWDWKHEGRPKIIASKQRVQQRYHFVRGLKGGWTETPVRFIKFFKDSSGAVFGGAGSVRLIDIPSGAVRQRYTPTKFYSKNTALSANGRFVLFGEQGLEVWDIQTGSPVLQKNVYDIYDLRVFYAAVSSAGDLAVSAHRGQSLLWNLETGLIHNRFQTLDRHVRDFHFTHDGGHFLGIHGDGGITVWETDGVNPRYALDADAAPFLTTVFLPDDKHFLAGRADGSLTLHETATGRVVRRLRNRSLRISALAHSPAEPLLATGTEDGTVHIWSLKAAEERKALKLHRARIHDLTFTADGRGLVTAGGDGLVKTIDVATGEVVGTYRGHIGAVRAVAVDPHGRHIYSAGNDRVVNTWSYSDKRRLRSDHGHTRRVSSLTLSPDDGWLASGSNDGRILVRNVADGQLVRTLDFTHGWVRDVAFAPDGETVAAAGFREIRLWDLQKDHLRHILGGQAGYVTALAFSADGQYLVAGGEDGTVRSWEVARGREHAVFRGHTDTVTGVSLSPDGQHLYSCSQDASTRIWDFASGLELVKLMSSRDGEWVATTPEGFYHTSPEGTDLIRWGFRDELESFSFEQFASEFNRREVVRERLRVAPAEAPRAVALTAPPVVHMDDHLGIRTTDADLYPLQVAVRGYEPVQAVRVFVNGRDVREMRLNARRATVRCDVPLVGGANRITAVAYDRRGFSSNPRYVDVISKASAVKPELHVLSIGISRYSRLPGDWQLAYAHTDARALSEVLQRQADRTFKRVQTTLLTNAEASAASILAALDRLRQVPEKDLVVIFMAGHGVRDEEGTFHFLAAGGQLSDPGQEGLNWLDLSRRIRAIRGRTILLLDACHAGSIVSEVVVPNNELAQDFFTGKRSGVMVFSASKGRQFSLESPDIGGGFGLFTYALVQALGPRADQADMNANRSVEFSELVDYVRTYVDRESGGSQTPWLSRKELFGDLPIAVVP